RSRAAEGGLGCASVVRRAHRHRLLRFVFFQAEDGIRDLTVTGVQTCALPIYRTRRGRKVVTVDPDAARDAFDVIERVSAESLDELRRILGILRAPGDEAAPLTPQPKLAELCDLVDLDRKSVV